MHGRLSGRISAGRSWDFGGGFWPCPRRVASSKRVAARPSNWSWEGFMNNCRQAMTSHGRSLLRRPCAGHWPSYQEPENRPEGRGMKSKPWPPGCGSMSASGLASRLSHAGQGSRLRTSPSVSNSTPDLRPLTISSDSRSAGRAECWTERHGQLSESRANSATRMRSIFRDCSDRSWDARLKPTVKHRKDDGYLPSGT